MKKTFVFLIPVLLLLLSTAGCQVRATGKPAVQGKTIRIIRHSDLNIQFNAGTRDRETGRFLTLINRYRSQKGLKPLSPDKKLQQAAQWMSDDMAAENYLDHRDSKGRDPFKRLSAFGYDYNTYKAENIAAGQQTADKVLKSWQDSKTHNANMLNPNFAAIGIGFAYDKRSKYGWYWATTFGGRNSKN